MQYHFQLTVTDILKRKHFENIQFIAGQRGLYRVVKWVHVVEVTKIKSLLNGNELILSTGVGWRNDPQAFIAFLQELIESNASGLCIDMGPLVFPIPQEGVALANAHQFPILLFLKEVPFVEITHDIHSHLIHQHYQMISNLEEYSQQLNKKLLSIQHHEEILWMLHDYLGHTVLFRMKEEDVQVIPSSSDVSYAFLAECQGKELLKKRVAHQSIQVLGHNYADLYIYSEQEEIGEYDMLILDRTSTAVAQHLLRDLYVEEKKRVEENEWVNSWLHGEHTEIEITDFLKSSYVNEKCKGGTVCICKFHEFPQSGSDKTYFKLLFRTIFEQLGFCTLSTEKRNEATFILLNYRDAKNQKQRLELGIEKLLNSEFIKKRKTAVTVGVGKLIEQLSDMHRSFKTAKETIRVQHNLAKVCHFYEDLHMYRILSMMNEHSDLQGIVMEYLDPVIRYDKKYNGKLMETLRVYLSCNGSKQETANRLFVVRQTLYHRITKLEGLLGSNFMNSEKRLVIEFMLQAYDYLVSTKQMKQYPVER